MAPARDRPARTRHGAAGLDSVRVVIGEDQALMREGLVLLLERAGFEVTAAVGDAGGLERTGLAFRPDLVVADIRMSATDADDGLQAALAIRKATPAVAVLILSEHVEQRYAEELMGSGADGVGYLLKQRVADVDTFCADARRVASGGTVLDPEVVSAMLTRARRHDPLSRLTARQREVLVLMAEGRSNGAIAKRLRLTGKAVVRHVSHIYDELGLAPGPDDHRRVLAVVHYLSR
jgi:DNA-binding NarL/FixJ family response regulator